MGFRWASENGLQKMGFRKWASDGLQMGFRWASDGLQKMGFRWASDGLQMGVSGASLAYPLGSLPHPPMAMASAAERPLEPPGLARPPEKTAKIASGRSPQVATVAMRRAVLLHRWELLQKGLLCPGLPGRTQARGASGCKVKSRRWKERGRGRAGHCQCPEPPRDTD